MAQLDRRFLVRVSYLQIYNEDVCDLLGKNPTTKLEVVVCLYLRVCVSVCAHEHVCVRIYVCTHCRDHL